MKSFYIAARPRYRMKEVARLDEFLIDLGLENTFDWSTDVVNEEVKRPYMDNPKSSADIGASNDAGGSFGRYFYFIT